MVTEKSIQITDNGVTKTLGVFSGLSTDVKPTYKIFNGSEFYEMNTGKLYRFDMANTTWILQATYGQLVANVYDSTQTYNKDAFVIYEGVLYVANQNNITGTWDSTKWTQTNVGSILENLKKPFVFVSTRPATGIEGKVYFVPSTSPATGDIFEEYIWNNNTWERIGGTSMDLSNYYTKTEVDARIGEPMVQFLISSLSSGVAYAEIGQQSSNFQGFKENARYFISITNLNSSFTITDNTQIKLRPTAGGANDITLATVLNIDYTRSAKRSELKQVEYESSADNAIVWAFSGHYATLNNIKTLYIDDIIAVDVPSTDTIPASQWASYAGNADTVYLYE